MCPIKKLVILLCQEAKRRTPASGASRPQGKGGVHKGWRLNKGSWGFRKSTAIQRTEYVAYALSEKLQNLLRVLVA